MHSQYGDHGVALHVVERALLEEHVGLTQIQGMGMSLS